MRGRGLIGFRPGGGSYVVIVGGGVYGFSIRSSMVIVFLVIPAQPSLVQSSAYSLVLIVQVRKEQLEEGEENQLTQETPRPEKKMAPAGKT